MNWFERTLAGTMGTVILAMFTSREPWMVSALLAVACTSAAYLAVLGIKHAVRNAGIPQPPTPAQDTPQPESVVDFAHRKLNEGNERIMRVEKQRIEMKRNGVATQKPVDAKPIRGTTAQQEAVSVVKFMRSELGLPVTVRRLSDVTHTPLNTVVRLFEKSPVSRRDIEHHVEEIGRQLSRIRGAKKRVGVHVYSSDAIYLQYGRQDPQDHGWENRPSFLPPATTCAGDYWMAGERKHALIDMLNDDVGLATGLICGISGSGKSRLIKLMLLSAFENSRPDQFSVYINELKFDTRDDRYDVMLPIPHVKSVTRTKDELLDLLRMVNDWCDNGKPKGAAGVVLLLLDEVHDAILDQQYKSEVVSLILRIMTRGRAIGIRVWLSTQTPDKDRIPPSLKTAFHFKIACYTPDDGYLKNPLRVYGASSLCRQRECVVVSEFINQSVAMYRLSDEGFMSEVSRIAEKTPPDQRRSAVGDDPVRTLDEPIKPARELTDDEAVLAYRMWDKSHESVCRRDAMSLNKLYYKIYGGPGGGKRREYMNNAFDRARILLRITED